MQAIITENREKIAELCRAHHVRRLSVFGSAVRDDFDPEHSDVDLLVEFDPMDGRRYAANYFTLERSLAQVLDRPVDLIVHGSVKNPYLLRHIVDEQTTLYAA